MTPDIGTLERNTRLGGVWLVIARAVWVVIAVMSLAILVAYIPTALAQLGQITVMERPIFSTATPLPGFEFASDMINMLATTFASILCIGLAIVIFRRKSDDWMAIFTSFFLLLFGTAMTGPVETLFGAIRAGWVPYVYFVQGLLLLIAIPFLLFLFPDGRFVPRWTRWLALGLVLFTLFGVIAGFINVRTMINPSGITAFLFFVSVLTSVFAQFYRYARVSTSLQRQQTKWVVYGFVLWLVVIILSSVPYYYLLNTPNTPNSEPTWQRLILAIVGRSTWVLSQAIVPISLTVAILRYRLWDIDVIIRRTLIYGALTGTLGVIYIASVVLFGQVFRSLIGHDSQFAIVISTLGIAALFTPLRRRIQNDIDRRFYRRKYNAQRTLEAFTAKLRDEVELDELSAHLVAVVQETMQPESVSLWIKPSPPVPFPKWGEGDWR